MIADHMRRLFSYNNWAWQHVYKSIEQLSSVDYHASRPIFHHSIHSLLVHSFAAEQIWYVRCQGESPTILPDPAEFPDFAAVNQTWSIVRHSWANYLQWLSDDDCKRMIEYRNTAGTPSALHLSDILQHVMNHATEHRSQLTPVLVELGVPTRPLDYAYYRAGRT